MKWHCTKIIKIGKSCFGDCCITGHYGLICQLSIRIGMLELFVVFVIQSLVKLCFSLLKGFYYLASFGRLKITQYRSD